MIRWRGRVDKSEIGAASSGLTASARRGPTVLIIEDHPAQAELVATIVSSLGYHCELASDGAKGLAMLRETHPVLILLDLNMPQFDGLGFLQRFKSSGEFSTVPVIVTTASQSIEVITKVCAMGARDFIPKPIDPATLIAKVQKHAPIRARR